MSLNTADASAYQLNLPNGWNRADRWILRATELLACLVGGTFTTLIMLEVISRYVFDFSIFFINAAARFLLVWFFLLGAGLALRLGAHVGLELVSASLPRSIARVVSLVAQLLVLVFFLEMLWSGYLALGSASRQVDSALGVSIVWVMLAFPVGFVLLIYHQVALLVAAMRKPELEETQP